MEAPLIIEVVPMGNLANRLIQYLAALEIQIRVPGALLSNIRLPEIGIVVPWVEYDPARQDSLTLRDHEFLDIQRVALLVHRGAIRHLRLWNYCQRIENLPRVDVCRRALAAMSRRAEADEPYGDDFIVINIRAAEILQGVLHYPLLPIDFYRDIIDRSRKRPIFMGQIDDSDYCIALKCAFPDAVFHTSQGVLHDFEMMRTCSHLVISISTFSWLAGWLSTAKTVVLPMVGLFNRCFMFDTDLLPLDDPRYEFWSFPTYFGMPSPEFLRFQHRLANTWRRESVQRVRHILSARPLIRRNPLSELEFVQPYCVNVFFQHDLKPLHFDGAYNSLLERKVSQAYRIMDFDQYFYCHQYLDAARDITDGWYEDAFHHYVLSGSKLGYLPRQRELPNIGRGKKAQVSSVALESAEGPADVQAARAVDGEVRRGYAFRTKEEDSPWWMVDLGGEHEITDVFIYNRDDQLGHADAATPLEIELSSNGINWVTIHTCMSDRPFGDNSKTEALRWYPRPSVTGRFVRLIVRRTTTLHLRCIEIYGQPLEASAAISGSSPQRLLDLT